MQNMKQFSYQSSEENTDLIQNGQGFPKTAYNNLCDAKRPK